MHAQCVPSFAGMGGYIGVSAAEVLAACTLLKMPRSQWSYIARGVQLISNVIAERVQQERKKQEDKDF